jgi:hypothetical protein
MQDSSLCIFLTLNCCWVQSLVACSLEEGRFSVKYCALLPKHDFEQRERLQQKNTLAGLGREDAPHHIHLQASASLVHSANICQLCALRARPFGCLTGTIRNVIIGQRPASAGEPLSAKRIGRKV